MQLSIYPKFGQNEKTRGITMSKSKLTLRKIQAYTSNLRLEEKSEATIEKYLHVVRNFASWLNGREIEKERTSEWKAYLIAQGYAPATINAMLSALNSLLLFLGRRDCRVKYLRIQRRLFRDNSRELTKSEYDRLLASAKKLERNRLALLIETIGATGIRVSEVKYITMEAVEKGKAEISSKGKIRVILLPSKLCRKLQKYCRKRKITSGAVFRTRNDRALSRYQIWAELKDLCKYASVSPEKVFPHNLRHLFATVFYRACKDIAKLADLLGHSSIETTRIYLVTSGMEHRQALDKLGFIS